VYTELNVPLLSERNALPFGKLLELQLAGRYDDYRVNGSDTSISLLDPTPVNRVTNRNSSTNPTLGFRFKPIADLMLRASYGTGFLPPSVVQLTPNPATPIDAGTAALFGLTDPRRGNEPVGAYSYLSGGNPDLQPEKSQTVSVGLVLTPLALRGFRASVDWTKIEKTDAIVNVASGFSQSDVDDERYLPALIVRAPAPPGDPFGVGPITGINAGLFNIARAEVQAFDFAVGFETETAGWGKVSFDAAATYMEHLTSQIIASSPTVEAAGVSPVAGLAVPVTGGIKWRANSTATWSYRHWAVGWASRFFDGYFLNSDHSVNANQGSARIGSQIYHDVFGSYRFGSQAERWNWLADSDVQVGVQNLFNRSPPVDVTSNAGYSLYGDPRLASYYLRVRKTFAGP
jgi:iron complex outermembrane recepter protein